MSQLYCQIYIYIYIYICLKISQLHVSALMAIFRLYTKLDEKTIYTMVHDIHKCGVRGDEISFTKVWRACGITQIHDLSGVYMYGVLAGGVLGVGLLVCGVVSAVSMGGWCTGLLGHACGRELVHIIVLQKIQDNKLFGDLTLLLLH